jgi:hypothetical protein
MAPPNLSSGDPIVDPSDIRFRVRTITTGVVLGIAQFAATIGYCLLTPEGAHRDLIVPIALVAMAASTASTWRSSSRRSGAPRSYARRHTH